MEDITDNLLHWSWYTTRFLGIIEEARRSRTDKSIKELEKQYLEQLKKERSIKNKEFPLINPGYLMMLAYALLVLPKEIMKKKKLSANDFSFNTINLFKFIVPKNYNSKTHNKFLVKMRNAVSHGHFKLEADQNSGSSLFTFWDEYNGKENFRVTITNEGFFQFLDEVGKYYSNKVGKP